MSQDPKEPPKPAVRIDDLAALLETEGESWVEILPDGSVRVKEGPREPKPLTMRQNLGGEYA